MINTGTAKKIQPRLIAAVAAVFLGLLLLVPGTVRAANYNFDADTDVVLSNGISLKILSGSRADVLSIDFQAGSFTVTVAASDPFKLRYPGPNPGSLVNDGGLAPCTFTSGNNDLIFLGPKTVTFTPATTLCAASGGGGGSVAVTLSQPNGGETLNSGASAQIFWGSSGAGINSIRLSLSLDGGASYSSVIAASEVNDGAYAWTVPFVATSSMARVKVEAIGSGTVLLSSDESNANFTIQGPPPASGGGGGGGGSAPPPATVETPPPAAPALPPVPEGPYDPTPLSAAELLAPPLDPTRVGAYSATTARDATPTINIDKGIVPPQGQKLPCVGGDLVKSVGSQAVYYCGKDGRRYVFPNEGTYFSWFPDFKNVKTISAVSMAAIPLGTNITYRPGTKMIKIQTDPKVYAVSRGGLLRWVTTEALAAALYGAEWNKSIRDVSDAFFVNYKVGDPIQ